MSHQEKYNANTKREGRWRSLPPPPLVPFDAAAEIQRHLSILVTRWPPKVSSFLADRHYAAAGLYAGPTSIAFMLVSYKRHLPAQIEGRSPGDWAKAYLDVSEQLWAQGCRAGFQLDTLTSERCGTCMERVPYFIVRAIVYQDTSLLAVLWDSVPAVLRTRDDTNEDWTIGRAGFLFWLRFLRTELEEVASRVLQIESQLIDEMLPREWLYNGHKYLGIGHGQAGIATQILLSAPTSRLTEVAAALRPRLVEILAAQDGNGNWPAYTGHSAPGGLMQMSIGAPGTLTCCGVWRTVYGCLGDEDMIRRCTSAIDSAQEVVWHNGYLTKEPCLLHGAAGNSLVLLDQARRAAFLAVSVQEEVDERVEDGTLEASLGDSGLQKGIAGRIAAMIEYQKGSFGVFASFNDY